MKKKYVFVLLGAIGDLAVNKVLPSLQTLFMQNDTIYKDIKIIAVDRMELKTSSYLDNLKKQNDRINTDFFKNIISYVKTDINNSNDFLALKEVIDNYSNKNSKILCFLSIPPKLILTASKNFLNSNIIENNNKNQSIIIEKPFGTNLKSAKNLKRQLLQCYTDDQIYKIDHYLGKDIVRGITELRFKNDKTTSIFNNQKIKDIKIIALEEFGILNRGSFYDETGATRDMVENHLFQLATLLTMDEPKQNTYKDMINCKVTALKNFNIDEKSILFGQYAGYKEEDNVSKNSNTETFVFLKMFANIGKNNNVPIYLMTGKKLESKETKIIVTFEDNSQINIDIANSKAYIIKDGKKELIKAYNDDNPYKALFLDAWNGNKQYFVDYDEIENAWEKIDRILGYNLVPFIYRNNQDILEALHKNNEGEFDAILWYYYANKQKHNGV